jgi:hypothetical protein
MHWSPAGHCVSLVHSESPGPASSTTSAFDGQQLESASASPSAAQHSRQ